VSQSDIAALEAAVRDLTVSGQVKIPPYPAVALRLQRTVGDGNFGLSDLARITSADAVLTATVLRMANSAYFRSAARVSALPDAISRIGAEELCRVALAASLGAVAGAHGPLAELRRTTWRQALGSALCSQVLAPLRGLGPQQAFLCGLLHEFGRVVGIAALEEVLATHPSAAPLTEADWVGIVDRVHVALGVLVGARWNLSDLLVGVMAGHHEPVHAVSPESRPFVELILAADEVVALLESCPYLLARDLLPVQELRGKQEIDSLMQYIPLIPGYISGLDEPAAAPGSPARSMVEKPDTLLGNPRRDVDFPVVWVRTGGETSYRARYLTSSGIGFAGPTAMHEGTVVRLRAQTEGAPAELSGRVVLCRPQDRGHSVEVRLFALPGSAQGWWEQLAGAAPPAA
jgi:HD-like signal output (HDOD) protein